MRELVFFEYKKMMKRKSVWISVCAMLFVVLLCSNLSLLGSVYVDDHKVFSHFEEIQIRREGGEKLEGAVLEEGFLEKNVEEYEVYLADRDSGKITWENYQTVQEEVASAQLLSWWVERLAPGFQEEMQADNFYSRREESMEESWKAAGFSYGSGSMCGAGFCRRIQYGHGCAAALFQKGKRETGGSETDNGIFLYSVSGRGYFCYQPGNGNLYLRFRKP